MLETQCWHVRSRKSIILKVRIKIVSKSPLLITDSTDRILQSSLPGSVEITAHAELGKSPWPTDRKILCHVYNCHFDLVVGRHQCKYRRICQFYGEIGLKLRMFFLKVTVLTNEPPPTTVALIDSKAVNIRGVDKM